MKIAVLGRGTVGGGLASLWRTAGHEVDAFGRDGGDVSAADVVVLAVPGSEVESALAMVDGVAGKIVVDATNPLSGRPGGVDSLSAQVKAQTGGPVAKALNTNFAALYERLPEARTRPSCLYCADDEARQVAETLVADAGYEPVYCGGLDRAGALEDFVAGVMLPLMSARGPFLYRVGGVDDL